MVVISNVALLASVMLRFSIQIKMLSEGKSISLKMHLKMTFVDLIPAALTFEHDGTIFVYDGTSLRYDSLASCHYT